MPRLRRSDPTSKGYTRRRSGRGFSYLDANGRRITDAGTLTRIKSLAIPPAWTDVWIAPFPNAHIQVLGTDDAGRRQYLYHEQWHASRSQEKYARAEVLGQHLPSLRRHLKRGVGSTGLTRERVLSCAVRLLDLGLFRVGSEQYTKENDSFGLATIRRDHVRVVKEGVSFEFPAKSGQVGQILVSDPMVCAVLQKLMRRSDDSPELLGWWDRSRRQWADVKSASINEYIKELTSEELTAKDFRTWHASVLMAMNLSVHHSQGEDLTKTRLNESFRDVAAELGNTPAIVRNSYVDPRVVDLAQQGRTIRKVRMPRHDLVPLPASNALVDLLRREADE